MAWWEQFPGRTIHWPGHHWDFVPASASSTLCSRKTSRVPFSFYFPHFLLCTFFCVSLQQQIWWLVDCSLKRKGQCFEADIFWIESTPGVCCDSYLEIILALCWSLADWSPMGPFCLIICMATRMRDGLQEWPPKSSTTTWGHGPNNVLGCILATDKIPVFSQFYLHTCITSCWVQWAEQGINTAGVRFMTSPPVATKIISFFWGQWEIFLVASWASGHFDCLHQVKHFIVFHWRRWKYRDEADIL